MNQLVKLVILIFLSLGNGITSSNPVTANAMGTAEEELKVLNFEELQSYLNSKEAKKTYVVNFWATWCAPCVKELPYFEQLNANYSNADVEVILVSLDFPKHIDSKLKPFLKKNALNSEVILLDDIDSNTWIPKVDKNWSGAIPATIIYNKSRRQFYERSFNYEELETELQQFIK